MLKKVKRSNKNESKESKESKETKDTKDTKESSDNEKNSNNKPDIKSKKEGRKKKDKKDLSKENYIVLREEVVDPNVPLFKLGLWDQLKIAIMHYDIEKGISKKKEQKRKLEEARKFSIEISKVKNFIQNQIQDMSDGKIKEKGCILERKYEKIINYILEKENDFYSFSLTVKPINKNLLYFTDDIPILLIIRYNEEVNYED